MLTNEQMFFCGLFFGEGSVIIARRRKKDNSEVGFHWTYRPELIMRLRSDDRPTLEWIADVIGGKVIDVYISPTSGNPMSQWYWQGYKNVPAVLEMMLQCPYPSKKKNEIALVLEMCNLRETFPFQLTQDHRDILDNYFHSLKAMRHYQGSGG